MYICRNRKDNLMTIEDIDDYINRHERSYQTKDFIYSSYHSPHTMYKVSNDVDEILLTMSFHAIKMWHRSLSLLKRNLEPSKACTVAIVYSEYSDILSRNYFYKALRELLQSKLLFATVDKHIYVINLIYANKLYSPKLDIEIK